MTSIQKVIIVEKKKMNEECLQPLNPLGNIVEIVQKTECLEITSHLPKYHTVQPSEILLPDEENGLWTMDFDGAVGKEVARIGVWIHGSLHQSCKIPHNVRMSSYKLAFECSNNEAEYEALIAGLKILKKLRAKKFFVYGDSKLVIKQVKGEYHAKHPRMRAYHNVVLDILKTFTKYTLSLIPRIQNVIADSLATVVSMVNIPIHSNQKYSIHVKHHQTIPDNMRFCEVFWDDKQINNFL